MFITERLRRPGILFAAIAAFLAVFLGGAQAASAAPGQVVHEDVTGAVFTCTDGSTYTVLSGEAMFLNHESNDAAGGFHITGTIAPTHVRLDFSGDNAVYRLAGAAWFGGNATAGGTFQFTDTEYFTILGASGGVVDTVRVTSHVTVLPDGTVVTEFNFDNGTCHTPEDEG
jgi:hypothetical protein